MCHDAPGASPRRCGAPVAIVPYYLYSKKERKQVIRGIISAPAPNGGRAGAKGAIIFSEIGFLQSMAL